MTEVDYQTTPGRLTPCCPGMRMAVSMGYIQRGFMLRRLDPPKWCHWGFNLQGEGWVEKSPIHYCPFCGIDLDKGE